jgi:putative flavoprotein involved in K+ transport
MFVFKHVITRRTPIGRAKLAEFEGRGVNLVRNKLAHLDAAGITRLGRITNARDGRPVTEDGPVPEVSTVVWATGSQPEHAFLDLPVFDDRGHPLHRRGIVDAEPGLYFLGLELQFAIASATIQGLDRDARFIVRDLRRRARSIPRETRGATRPAVAA